MRAWLGVLVLGAGCGGDTIQTVDAGTSAYQTDEEGPLIEHEDIEAAQLIGMDVTIVATVTDELSEVDLVQVFFKASTSVDWETGDLNHQGDGVFTGKIPGIALEGGGMHYFLYAVDTESNEAELPEDGPDDPFYFRISGD